MKLSARILAPIILILMCAAQDSAFPVYAQFRGGGGPGRHGGPPPRGAERGPKRGGSPDEMPNELQNLINDKDNNTDSAKKKEKKKGKKDEKASADSTVYNLDEFTIVARRELIKSDGDKLSYDVSRDPAAAVMSTSEILRRVPTVAVDGDGNVTIKGQSNFKIYLNGREDPMLSENAAEVLKTLPASALQTIEVMSDPGAKYEAEGLGGILNLVTQRKTSIEGYAANARFSMGTRGLNGGLFGMTKIGKVVLSLNYGIFDRSLFQPKNLSLTEREDFTTEIDRFMRTRSEGSSDELMNRGGFNLSWEPDTLNLFTFSLRLNGYNNSGYSRQTVSMSDIDNEMLWSFDRLQQANSSSLGMSASASYQHSFPGNKRHNIVLSYRYHFRRRPGDRYMSLDNFVNNPPQQPDYSQNRNKTYANDHTLQLDYTLPLIGDKHSLEAGAKATIRPTRSSQSMFYSPDGIDYELNQNIGMVRHEDNYAAYLSYSASFRRFKARAGVRYEHTRLGIDYRTLFGTENYNDFHTNLDDVVPNVSLTYKLTDYSNLRLAYSMRVRRPGVNQLNPFRNTQEYGNMSYGNPDLKSCRLNGVELKYSAYGNKFGGEFGARYTSTDNSIETYNFMEDGVMHSTFGNIGRISMLNLNGYLQYQITNSMDVSVNGQARYSDYKSTSIITLHNFGWDGSVNMNYGYDLPFGMRIDANGGWSSRGVNMQGFTDSSYYYGVTVSQRFLKKKKLMISITGDSFLPAWEIDESQRFTDTSRTYSWRRQRRWNLSFAISYRFGNLKAKVKDTNNRLESIEE